MSRRLINPTNLIVILLLALAGCQAAQRCVVTPNETVECN